MVPRWWSAAPDVIWYIYSHLHCSTGDGGRESPSSGEAALTMGQVPCEFWADWPRFTFLGEAKLRVLPALPCPGWCIIHGRQLQTWFGTFTHTCTAPQGIVVGLAVFWGGSLYHGEGPLWVSSRLANLHFSASSSWHDLAHLLRPVLLQGGFGYGPAIFRGCCPHHRAGPLWVLSRVKDYKYFVIL